MELLGYSLPDGIGPESLRHFLIGFGLVCIVGAVLAVRFIGKLAVRAWLAAALVGLGFLSFVQRAQLSQCAQTCRCEVVSLSVQMPGCQPQNEE